MPQKVLATFLSVFFVWLLITGFDGEEYLLGIIVSTLVAFISSRELIKGSVMKKFHPKRWFLFLVYVIVFTAAEVYSHLSFLVKVLLGCKDDGVFVLESKFSDPVALTLLGNSITLTPGTLTLDVEGNKLVTYVSDKGSEKMIKIFETFLEGIFK